jgi:NADPH2:quinone reductase
MSRYRALQCDALSPDLSGLRFVERDAVPPGPGQVAVEMRAMALNFPDLLMTRGGYQHKPEVPYVVGMEGAGVIIDVGPGVTGWKAGDAVCFSNLVGAIAERNIVPASALEPVPVGWDWPSAAGWRVGAVTAHAALVVRGQLKAGETLLVHGATGGMGAAAVQLGAHLGARVIATGTRTDWLELLGPMGASHRLSSRGAFQDEVKAITQGAGADVIYDPVGGDVFDKSTKCIAFGGRLMVVGFAAGRIPTLAANHVLIKTYSVVGVRAGEWMRKRPHEAPAIRAEINALAAQGVFKPLIGARYSFDQAIEALRSLETRQAPGKIVITL